MSPPLAMPLVPHPAEMEASFPFTESRDFPRPFRWGKTIALVGLCVLFFRILSESDLVLPEVCDTP